MADGGASPLQRPQRGDSLRGLADRVGDRLVTAVPEALRRAGFRGQFYCLVLSHGETLSPLTLILGRESERRSIVTARGAAAGAYLYAPAEPAMEYVDIAGAGDYALFDEEVARQNAWELGRRALRRAARELSALDWSGILDVTDDFIVLDRDYEADDRAESIAACAPPEKLAAIRGRGWA